MGCLQCRLSATNHAVTRILIVGGKFLVGRLPKHYKSQGTAPLQREPDHQQSSKKPTHYKPTRQCSSKEEQNERPTQQASKTTLLLTKPPRPAAKASPKPPRSPASSKALTLPAERSCSKNVGQGTSGYEMCPGYNPEMVSLHKKPDVPR